MKRNTTIREVLDFDDVLLSPAESAVKPADVSTKTMLTRTISLGIPLISAGWENVTESAMAIAMARLGGIGVIHDNMPMGKQVEEVRKVKRAESEMIASPITIAPDSNVAEAFDLMTSYRISGLPVIDQQTKKVVGIITRRDIRFLEDYNKQVHELMTKNVITAKTGVNLDAAKKLLHQHRIEKLVVVDDQEHCIGLITVRDIEQRERYLNAARDASGRLRVGARVGAGKDAFDRAAAMTDAGLDVVFVDSAHGHTRDLIGTVSRIRQQRSNDVQIVAGNVATADAARSLIDAGADAIKVGIGATENSATREITGIGIPQLTAILDVTDECGMQNVPVIVDGGIHNTAQLAKAIAAGASCVMFGRLFAGTDEAPGEIISHGDQICKIVRPTPGTAGKLSVDPYRVGDGGFDAVPCRGSVAYIAAHLVDTLKIAMAYSGSKDIAAMHETAELVKVK